MINLTPTFSSINLFCFFRVTGNSQVKCGPQYRKPFRRWQQFLLTPGTSASDGNQGALVYWKAVFHLRSPLNAAELEWGGNLKNQGRRKTYRFLREIPGARIFPCTFCARSTVRHHGFHITRKLLLI